MLKLTAKWNTGAAVLWNQNCKIWVTGCEDFEHSYCEYIVHALLFVCARQLVWVESWIYHFYADIVWELPDKSQQLLFMQGWHSGEGVYYSSRQLFCQPGPIRSLAVGLSTNERRPGKRTSVQRQCSAGFGHIEQRHCAAALASSPVTWSYRGWCWNWTNPELYCRALLWLIGLFGIDLSHDLCLI